MSIATQAKILRVLQSNTFERVGGTETIKVDVRIIAATHQNLEKLIAEGKFREDLYYRLRVMEILLPPLRERREDVPEIVRFLLQRHREALNSEAANVSPRAMDQLMNCDWPGNIRQLENVIRRAMVLCNGSMIGTEHLEFGPDSTRYDQLKPSVTAQGSTLGGIAPPPPAAAAASHGGINMEDMDHLVERLLSSGRAALIEEMERLLIGRALERLNGNQLQTAKLLGITRNTLRSRIEKYGLRPKVKVM
jgi:DNA-binding NtrC family response regulator